MKDLIIFGAGGHGAVMADVISQSENYRVLGFLDDKAPVNSKVLEYKVLGTIDELPKFDAECTAGVVAIGDNWVRELVVKRILDLSPQFDFPVIIHPSACIGADVKLQPGTMISAGVTINPGTTIGTFCKVNTNASIDHDCTLESFSSVNPGATLGGNVSVGAYSTVLLGANVIHSVSIGEHSVIGAGATVLEDIPSFTLAYGSPARAIRERKAGEPYL